MVERRGEGARADLERGVRGDDDVAGEGVGVLPSRAVQAAGVRASGGAGDGDGAGISADDAEVAGAVGVVGLEDRRAAQRDVASEHRGVRAGGRAGVRADGRGAGAVAGDEDGVGEIRAGIREERDRVRAGAGIAEGDDAGARTARGVRVRESQRRAAAEAQDAGGRIRGRKAALGPDGARGDDEAAGEGVRGIEQDGAARRGLDDLAVAADHVIDGDRVGPGEGEDRVVHNHAGAERAGGAKCADGEDALVHMRFAAVGVRAGEGEDAGAGFGEAGGKCAVVHDGGTDLRRAGEAAGGVLVDDDFAAHRRRAGERAAADGGSRRHHGSDEDAALIHDYCAAERERGGTECVEADRARATGSDGSAEHHIGVRAECVGVRDVARERDDGRAVPGCPIGAVERRIRSGRGADDAIRVGDGGVDRRRSSGGKIHGATGQAREGGGQVQRRETGSAVHDHVAACDVQLGDGLGRGAASATGEFHGTAVQREPPGGWEHVVTRAQVHIEDARVHRGRAGVAERRADGGGAGALLGETAAASNRVRDGVSIRAIHREDARGGGGHRAAAERAGGAAVADAERAVGDRGEARVGVRISGDGDDAGARLGEGQRSRAIRDDRANAAADAARPVARTAEHRQRTADGERTGHPRHRVGDRAGAFHAIDGFVASVHVKGAAVHLHRGPNAVRRAVEDLIVATARKAQRAAAADGGKQRDGVDARRALLREFDDAVFDAHARAGVVVWTGDGCGAAADLHDFTVSGGVAGDGVPDRVAIGAVELDAAVVRHGHLVRPEAARAISKHAGGAAVAEDEDAVVHRGRAAVGVVRRDDPAADTVLHELAEAVIRRIAQRRGEDVQRQLPADDGGTRAEGARAEGELAVAAGAEGDCTAAGEVDRAVARAVDDRAGRAADVVATGEREEAVRAVAGADVAEDGVDVENDVRCGARRHADARRQPAVRQFRHEGLDRPGLVAEAELIHAAEGARGIHQPGVVVARVLKGAGAFDEAGDRGGAVCIVKPRHVRNGDVAGKRRVCPEADRSEVAPVFTRAASGGGDVVVNEGGLARRARHVEEGELSAVVDGHAPGAEGERAVRDDAPVVDDGAAGVEVVEHVAADIGAPLARLSGAVFLHGHQSESGTRCRVHYLRTNVSGKIGVNQVGRVDDEPSVRRASGEPSGAAGWRVDGMSRTAHDNAAAGNGEK